jgi:hypothetical protein
MTNFRPTSSSFRTKPRTEEPKPNRVASTIKGELPPLTPQVSLNPHENPIVERASSEQIKLLIEQRYNIEEKKVFSSFGNPGTPWRQRVSISEFSPDSKSDLATRTVQFGASLAPS